MPRMLWFVQGSPELKRGVLPKFRLFPRMFFFAPFSIKCFFTKRSENKKQKVDRRPTKAIAIVSKKMVLDYGP